MNKPFVTTIPGVIEQQYLNEMLDIVDYEPSTGFNVATGKAEPTAHRTSSTYYDREPKFNHVRDIILEILKEQFGHIYLPEQCEPFQLQKYVPGQFFKPHHDYFNVPGYEQTTDNDRIATVIVYIKTATKGGTTNFPKLDLNIKANAGDLVYFTYDDDETKILTQHEGTSIEEGEKIIATLWIRKGEYK